MNIVVSTVRYGDRSFETTRDVVPDDGGDLPCDAPSPIRPVTVPLATGTQGGR